MSEVYRVGYKSNNGVVFSETAEVVGDTANDYMDVVLCKNDVIDNDGQRFIVGDNDMWIPFHAISPRRKRIVAIGNESGVTAVAAEWQEQLAQLRADDAEMMFMEDDYNRTTDGAANRWGM